MSAQPATVFVVDDDLSMLRSLARLLRVAGHIVETFPDPFEFLARAPYQGNGCIILDLNLPQMSGIMLQEKLIERGSTLPIIFVTGAGDIPTAVKAVKSGAVDFLTKPFSNEELLALINQSLETHAKQLAGRTQIEDMKARFDALTPREREVIILVGRGFLNKQIAADLGIVEKTIKVHRAHAMEKLQVESVAELVDLLREIGTR